LTLVHPLTHATPRFTLFPYTTLFRSLSVSSGYMIPEDTQNSLSLNGITFRMLPFSPQLARSLRRSIASMFQKLSSEIFQPTDTDGKLPHWFPSGSTLAPSRRIVASSMYLLR